MDLMKFGDVDRNKPKNTFPQPNRKITTMQFGKLYPSLLKEVIPNTNIELRSSKLMRMLPLLAPMMSNCMVFEDFYFVPNRIVWSNWEKFITGTGVDVEMPWVTIKESSKNTNITNSQTLAAYLGTPVVAAFYGGSGTSVNAIPFAAYNAIYNHYYRNNHMQNEVVDTLVDGDNDTEYELLVNNDPYLKNFKKDYFFGATLTPQHGISVLLPVTTQDDLDILWRAQTGGQAAPVFKGRISGVVTGPGEFIQSDNGTGDSIITDTDSETLSYDPRGSLYLNVNNQAATIDSLRTAFALQKFLEMDLVGGLEYIENIFTHYGAIIPDYRASEPEWIGSTSSFFDITEVLSKSETTSEDSGFQPLGSLAGHGFNAAGSETMRYYAVEHGFCISIISIVPELIYPNKGLAKHWVKWNRNDYGYPAFAELGMQPVDRNELVYNGIPETWGYRPIYDEYRHSQSIASGDITQNLDFWADYVKIDVSINLGPETIKVDQRLYDLDRIFSIDTDGPSEVIIDYIYVDTHYDLMVTLPLPRFNIPNIS